MTTLVFVHGRNQQGRDPDQLRGAWTEALNRGLGTAHPAVDAASVVFPFYGDVLHAKTLEAVKAGADIELAALRQGTAHIDPAVPADVAATESELLRSLVAEVRTAGAPAAAAAGIVRDGLFDGIGEAIVGFRVSNRILRWIARNTGVAQEIIEAFLRDVAVYLRVAREDVLSVVRDALPADGDLLIVSHSLGTAVARDLLDEPAVRERTVAWVTAGSPLGLEAVYRNLKTPGPAHPKVPAWATVWDSDDFVALGHPIAGMYGRPLDEFEVDNPDGRAHSIEEYLAHAEVARWIGARLAG